MTLERTESEIRRLLETVDAEYQSAQYALTGLSLGTAQHAFITARLERIEGARQELINLVGNEDVASRLVIQQIEETANRGEN